MDDWGTGMTDDEWWRAWFDRGQHHYTPLIMAAIERGDIDSYHAVVNEMGEEGLSGSALLCWAMVLAAVGTDPAATLPQYVDMVPEADWDLVYRHARVLINTARSSAGEARVLTQRWRQTSDALGNDQLWYLIRVLARAVHPVLTTLGNMNIFGSTSELVNTVWPERVPRTSQPSMAAAHAAIASGHPADGLAILDRVIVSTTTIQDRLNATLAVSSEILADTQFGGMVDIDEHGSLAGLSTLSERSPIEDVLAAGIAKAFGTGDLSLFDTTIRPALERLSDAELDRIIYILILTSGVRLGQRLAELLDTR